MADSEIKLVRNMQKCCLLIKTTNILSVSSKFVSLYQKNALHFTPNHYSSTVFKEHQWYCKIISHVLTMFFWNHDNRKQNLIHNLMITVQKLCPLYPFMYVFRKLTQVSSLRSYVFRSCKAVSFNALLNYFTTLMIFYRTL